MHNLKDIRKDFSKFEKDIDKRLVKIDIVNLKKLNAVYVTAPQNSINQLKKFIEDLDKVDTALNLEDKITIVEEKTTTIAKLAHFYK